MILELQSIKNKIDYLNDQSFDDDFLENIRKKRVNYIKAAQDNDFTDGLENLLTRLYPDNAHFVYELLQNAEDANATKIYFSLQEDCFYFLHNGSKNFSIDDINSITSIGKSQKVEDTNKIGKFGVGFKSVFSYTKTPSVHSSSISFLIKDMLMPSKLESEEIPGQYTTLFIFPFNNSDKSKRTAYDEIFRLFNKLSNNTLLFLNGIQEINWSVGTQDDNSIKRKNKGDYIEICSTSEDSSYWYVFTKSINIKTNDESGDFDVKIAYAFDQDEGAIVGTRGGVSIFFPADSEVSELKFHIHAPFSSTVARDSIVKDNEENQQLINGIAELCCESLHELKKNNMLNTSFFEVLPNKDDGLSETYLPIYERIIKEFENEFNDLIPLGNNKFSNLKNCRFTKSNIKSIFNTDDLKVLLDNDNIQGFAINASQLNNRTDKFYQSLSRKFFNENDLIECLNTLNNDVLNKELDDALCFDDDNRFDEINHKREWLESKGSDWLQSLYALLFDFSESWVLNDVSDLTSLIKLSDDSFNYANDTVFFLETEQLDSEFKFANQATYLSGKKAEQKQKSKEFLEYVGVQNLDESVHIKLLFQDYEFESEEQHIKDIDRLVQSHVDEGDIGSEFNDFNFIYTSQKNITKPNKIAIDSPFESTGLQYVLNYQNTELLNPVYQNLKNSGAFLDLIKKLGARNRLNIERVNNVYGNPNYSSLVSGQGGRQTCNGIDEDWIIEDLKSILVEEENRFEISKLVWNTMCNFKQKQYCGSVFEASYRCNGEYPTNITKSQLVHILSDIDWIPGKDGEFYNPKDIDKESLPSDFIYNNENGWLDRIEFGLNVQFTTDDRRKAEDLIKSKTGMSVDQLEQFKNIGISPKRLLELAEEEKQKQKLRGAMIGNQGSGETNGDNKNDETDEIIINDGKLQGDIAKENKEVIDTTIITSVKRSRQNPEELKKIRSFLYKQYKGHCQVCGDTFSNSKSENYFETFSLNRGEERDVNRKGNTLSLCPKHHAIFKEKMHKFSFIDEIPETDLTIGKIRERYSLRWGVGKADVINKNDGFFAQDDDGLFERDVFLLPIKIFNNNFYLKLTQEHMQNFIEVWNNN